jgi:WD40 repeat protein
MLSIIGKTIGGRYEIINLLGNGGFSNTYLARDKQLPTKPYCVIKHFRPNSNNSLILETARDLFNTEAKILYKLRNKSDQIPKLLAHLEEDEEFYLVEEFIEGKDLSHELIPGRQFDEAEVIVLLKETLSILKVIHQQGVIHRDIKPQNLIRCKDSDKIVLIDFGAVKQISIQLNSQMVLNQDREQVTTTIIIGTPGYMPTEQQVGKPRFSSDIYALGAIAIQALTGLSPTELPEDPQTGEILWHEQARVSLKLKKIIDRMVSNHFRDRYQAANSVLKDIQALQGSQSKTTILTRLTKPRLIESNLKWLVAGTALVLAIAGWNWFGAKDRKTQTSLPRQSSAMFPNKSFVDRIALVNTISVHSDAVFSVAISPDGQNFISGSADKTVKLWNLHTGELLYEFLGHSQEVVATDISPDGEIMVSGSRDKTINVWNLKTKKLLHTLKEHTNKIVCVTISPDGQTLFSGDEDAKIKVWNLESGKLLNSIDAHTDEVEFLALTPDGKTLVSSSEDKTVKIWNANTGQSLNTLRGHQKEVESIAISPDGKILVSGGGDKLIVWRLGTGEVLREIPQSGFVRFVSISADGKTLVSAHEDNTVKLWNLSNGKLQRTLSGHSDWVLSVATSPDQQTLITGSKDKTIQIWSTRS